MDKKNDARKASDRRSNDRRVKNVPVAVERRVANDRRTGRDRRHDSA